MKNKYKLFGVYLPLFCAALIATVIMRTIALFNDFSPVTGYFAQNSIVRISDYIVIGVSILMLSYIFTARKDMKLIPDFTTSATYVPTGIVGTSLLFLSVHFFGLADKSYKNIQKYKIGYSSADVAKIPNERILLILAIAVAILGLLSAVHFVICALIETGMSSHRAGFGLITVAHLSILAIYIYFNSSLPTNSPGKILDQMVYLLAAIFFLYETRLSLGREKWRPYIAFGFISSLVAAYSSIPSLIYFFTTKHEISSNIYGMLLSAALFIFITSRMLLTGSLIEDKESHFAKILAEASDARSAEIAPAAEEISEIADDSEDSGDENQITIDDVCKDSEEIKAPEEMNYTEQSAYAEENFYFEQFVNNEETGVQTESQAALSEPQEEEKADSASDEVSEAKADADKQAKEAEPHEEEKNSDGDKTKEETNTSNE